MALVFTETFWLSSSTEYILSYKLYLYCNFISILMINILHIHIYTYIYIHFYSCILTYRPKYAYLILILFFISWNILSWVPNSLIEELNSGYKNQNLGITGEIKWIILSLKASIENNLKRYQIFETLKVSLKYLFLSK